LAGGGDVMETTKKTILVTCKPDPAPDPEKLFFVFFYQRMQFLIPGLQEKPSALKRDHPALQNMKVLSSFIFIYIYTDPDLHFECGSGSSNSNKIRTHADPDSETLHFRQ
jgi:hypothetical protein